MCKRKKTGVHGTLEMTSLAWKFNAKQLLSKTLNSRMNIIETRAVLNMDWGIKLQETRTVSNIVNKCTPEAVGPRIITSKSPNIPPKAWG